MDSIGQYGKLMEVLRDADQQLFDAGRVDPERGAEVTKNIIRGAEHSISILGINALRPVHEGIEPISNIISSDGIVDVTMLDPFSQAFKDRELFEQTACGRLQLELNAAVAGLLDSYKRAGNKGNLRLFTHGKKPLISVVASDVIWANGEMQLNLYSDEQGKRGLKGKTYQLSANGIQAEQNAFGLCVDFLDALNKSSSEYSPQRMHDLLQSSCKGWSLNYK